MASASFDLASQQPAGGGQAPPPGQGAAAQPHAAVVSGSLMTAVHADEPAALPMSPSPFAAVQPQQQPVYLGVSWSPDQQQWEACMMAHGAPLHLGLFDDQEAAAHAYDRAVLKSDDPSAPTNFPATEYRTLRLRSLPASSDGPQDGSAQKGSVQMRGNSSASRSGQLSRRPPPAPSTGLGAKIPEGFGIGAQKPKGGPSKYRGVVWHKSNSKWEARIYDNGKQRFLGYFLSEEEAAHMYDAVAIKMHGNTAKLNFPFGQHPSALRADSASTPRLASQLKRASSAPAAVSPKTALPFALPSAAALAAAGRKGFGPQKGRALPIKGSSKFRGVSWNSNCCKWRAQVWKGSEVHHLGYYEDEEEAARAYDRAVQELRGPDANVNFPTPEQLSNANKKKSTRKSRSLSAQLYDNDDAMSEESQFFGVSWNPATHKWLAELWNGVKYLLLGSFEEEAQAAQAYDRACLSLYGTHANTNFPAADYNPEMAASTLLSAAHLLGSSDGPATANNGAEAAGKATVQVAAGPADGASAADARCGAQPSQPTAPSAPQGASDASGNTASHAAPARLLLSGSGEAAERAGTAEHAGSGAGAATRLQRSESTPTSGLRGDLPGGMPAASREAIMLPPRLSCDELGGPLDPLEGQVGGLDRRRSGRVSDADASAAAAALAAMYSVPAGAAEPGKGPGSARLPASRSGSDPSSLSKSSHYKGVSWHKHSHKWYAYIQSGGKMRGLGYFDLQEDAARAYDCEARKVHGSKAVVNFKGGVEEAAAAPVLPGPDGPADLGMKRAASDGEHLPSYARADFAAALASMQHQGSAALHSIAAPAACSAQADPATAALASGLGGGLGDSWRSALALPGGGLPQPLHSGLSAAEHLARARSLDHALDLDANLQLLQPSLKRLKTSHRRTSAGGPASGSRAAASKYSPAVQEALEMADMLAEMAAAGPRPQLQPLFPPQTALGLPTGSRLNPDLASGLGLGSGHRRHRQVQGPVALLVATDDKPVYVPRRSRASGSAAAASGAPIAGHRTCELAPEGVSTPSSGFGLRGQGFGRPPAGSAGTPTLPQQPQQQHKPLAVDTELGGQQAEPGASQVATPTGEEQPGSSRAGTAGPSQRPAGSQRALSASPFAQRQAADKELLGERSCLSEPGDASHDAHAGGDVSPSVRVRNISIFDFKPSQSGRSGELPPAEAGIPTPTKTPDKTPVPAKPAAAAPTEPAGISAGHTTQYIGVSWDAQKQQWFAHTTSDGKQQVLGWFDSDKEAAEAYDRAQLIFLGLHAETNFPLNAHLADPQMDLMQLLDTLGPSGVAPVTVSAFAAAAEAPLPSHHPASSRATPERSLRPASPQRPASSTKASSKQPGGQSSTATARAGGHSSGPSPSMLDILPSGHPDPEQALETLRQHAVALARKNIPPMPPAMEALTQAADLVTPQSTPPRGSGRSGRSANNTGSRSQSSRGGTPRKLDSAASKVTSRYKGVSWNHGCAKWVAVAWDRDSKCARHIGSFESEEEAARAFDAEALRMLGADAGVNFRDSAVKWLKEHPGQDTSPTATKGSSQYRGVSWHERSGRWEVRVWGEGKQHFVGSFDCELDAARGYDRAILRLRGTDPRSMSRLNFPPSDYDLEALDAATPSPDEAPLQAPRLGSMDSEAAAAEGLASLEDLSAAAVEAAEAAEAAQDQQADALGTGADAGPGGGTAAGQVDAAQTDAAQEAQPEPQQGTASAGQQQQQAQQAQQPAAAASSALPAQGLTGLAGLAAQQASLTAGRNPNLQVRLEGLGFGGQVVPQLTPSSQPPLLAVEDSAHALHGAHPVCGTNPQPLDSNLKGLVMALPPGPTLSASPGSALTPSATPTLSEQQQQRQQAPQAVEEPSPNLKGGLVRRSSQFKGVSWCEKGRKWRALLWDGTKQRFLGHFLAEEEAARTYDRAIIAIRGSDARTNFALSEYEEDGSLHPEIIASLDRNAENWGKRVPATPNKSSPGTSVFRGVSLNKGSGKWEARIRERGRNHYLGSYDVEEEAARAFDLAALALRGVDAQINFPPQDYTAEAVAAAAPRLGHSPQKTLEDSVDVLASLQATTARRGFRKVPGVTWDRRKGKWRAQIGVSDKHEPTWASFDTEAAAVEAYELYAAKKFVKTDAPGPSRSPGPQPSSSSGPQPTLSGPQQQAQSRSPGPQPSAPAPAGPQHMLPPLVRARIAALAAEDPQARSGAAARQQATSSGSSFLGAPAATRGSALASLVMPPAAPPARPSWPHSAAPGHAPAPASRPTSALSVAAAAAASAAGAASAALRPPAPQRSAVASATSTPQLLGAPLAEAAHPTDATTPTSQPALKLGFGPHHPHPTLGMVQTPEAANAAPQPSQLNSQQQQQPRPATAAEEERLLDEDLVSAALQGLAAEAEADAAALEAGSPLGAMSDQRSRQAGGDDDADRDSADSTPPLRASQRTPGKGAPGGAGPRFSIPATPGGRVVPHARGSSQYKGVSWSERSAKWRAQLWFENKVHHLGFYDDEIEAAKAYDAAVVELRGTTNATNFLHTAANAKAATPRGSRRAQVEGRATGILSQGGDPAAGASSLARAATAAAAAAGSAVAAKGSSSFRGVRWHERNTKWETRIFDGHKQVSLGYFDSETDAARAYDDMAIKLRGPYALTNFPASDYGITPKKRRRAAEAEEPTAQQAAASSGWGAKRPRGHNSRQPSSQPQQATGKLTPGPAPAGLLQPAAPGALPAAPYAAEYAAYDALLSAQRAWQPPPSVTGNGTATRMQAGRLSPLPHPLVNGAAHDPPEQAPVAPSGSAPIDLDARPQQAVPQMPASHGQASAGRPAQRPVQPAASAAAGSKTTADAQAVVHALSPRLAAPLQHGQQLAQQAKQAGNVEQATPASSVDQQVKDPSAPADAANLASRAGLKGAPAGLLQPTSEEMQGGNAGGGPSAKSARSMIEFTASY